MKGEPITATAAEKQRFYAGVLVERLESELPPPAPTELDVLDALAATGLTLMPSITGNPASEAYFAAFAAAERTSPELRSVR